MDVRIEAGRARGRVTAPPSKSCAHRLLICAALAGAGSAVGALPAGRDVEGTIACLSALGARFARQGETLVTQSGLTFPSGAVCPCGDSGSTLRFLLPVALLGGEETVFTGSPRLLCRGVDAYETALAPAGIAVEKGDKRLAARGRLSSGAYAVEGGVSSQFASGLLLALSALDGDSTLTVLPPVESRPYIDLTVRCLRRFGADVAEVKPNVFAVAGKGRLRPADVSVEGDWSNGAALLAFNALGGDVTVEGLDPDSAQGDRVCAELFARLGKPRARVDLSQRPDLGPILFALAAALGHGARFTGVRRLRLKESDRVSAMAEELEKFGVRAEAGEDELLIHAGAIHAPKTPLAAHGDHRVVMALSLLCTLTGGTIEGAQAVDKSFPDYFDRLRRLGLTVEEVARPQGD